MSVDPSRIPHNNYEKAMRLERNKHQALFKQMRLRKDHKLRTCKPRLLTLVVAKSGF